jgi:hypothetical protein
MLKEGNASREAGPSIETGMSWAVTFAALWVMSIGVWRPLSCRRRAKAHCG